MFEEIAIVKSAIGAAFILRPKHQRTGALHDASRSIRAFEPPKVLGCGSPLPLFLLLIPWLLLGLAFVLLIPVASGATPVSFTNGIAPILSHKCISCHDEKKAKGGLRLHSYAALMAGGK